MILGPVKYSTICKAMPKEILTFICGQLFCILSLIRFFDIQYHQYRDKEGALRRQGAMGALCFAYVPLIGGS
jgi:hypothetical protein